MTRLRSFLAALLVFTSGAWAAPIDVEIERTRDRFNLGISEFVPGNRSTDRDLAQAVRSTTLGDLRFSDLFNLVDEGPVVRRRSDATEWGRFGSDVVMGAEVERRGERLQVEATLFDTRSGREVYRINRTGDSAAAAQVAHEVANEVVKYFTGQPGIFTSRIVFVNDATGRKELHIADYDGKNARRLTNDSSIVILPRISHDAKRIVFTSYISGNPDLYLMNADGTGRRRISSKAGLNVSPSWSPSNNEIAVTLSPEGPPNIYLIDTDGRVQRRITDSKSADTAPSFSPDGSQIAFTSDRGGAPHIYLMGIDGTGLRRITTASHCDSAAWSPDGQTVLYVKGGGRRGSFDIYSIEVLTGIERRLTWGDGDNENPAWSPDGRFILFSSTRGGRSQLYIMSKDGGNQRPLQNIRGQSFTPHWSN